MPIDHDQLNQRSLPLLYREVLITQSDAFSLFDRHNLSYIHPSIHVRPSQSALQHSATFLVSRAANRAILLGAASGALGYAGIALEHASLSIHFLRLGQRLIALYGQAPQSAAGEALVLQAIGDVFEFKLDSYVLPRELTELKPFIESIQRRPQKPLPSTKWLIAKTATRYVFKRHFKHLFPAIGITVGAMEARRALMVHGTKLHQCISDKLKPNFTTNSTLDAVEISRS